MFTCMTVQISYIEILFNVVNTNQIFLIVMCLSFYIHLVNLAFLNRSSVFNISLFWYRACTAVIKSNSLILGVASSGKSAERIWSEMAWLYHLFSDLDL